MKKVLFALVAVASIIGTGVAAGNNPPMGRKHREREPIRTAPTSPVLVLPR